MRLVATEYLSLDGVFEEPGQWSFPFFNDEAGQFKWAELQAADAQLLGRKTYDGFSAAWPKMEGTGEFGVRMNTMPKYIVTSTLEKLEWPGSKPVKGDVAAEVRKLKETPGRDLLLAGSGQLLPLHGLSRSPRQGQAALRARVRPEEPGANRHQAIRNRHRRDGARAGQ